MNKYFEPLEIRELIILIDYQLKQSEHMYKIAIDEPDLDKDFYSSELKFYKNLLNKLNELEKQN